MAFNFFINLFLFVIFLLWLGQSKRMKWSLSLRVMLGLIFGLIFGSVLQVIYGEGEATLLKSIEWFNIVGNGYILLLQMIVMPLVFYLYRFSDRSFAFCLCYWQNEYNDNFNIALYNCSFSVGWRFGS